MRKPKSQQFPTQPSHRPSTNPKQIQFTVRDHENGAVFLAEVLRHAYAEWWRPREQAVRDHNEALGHKSTVPVLKVETSDEYEAAIRVIAQQAWAVLNGSTPPKAGRTNWFHRCWDAHMRAQIQLLKTGEIQLIAPNGRNVPRINGEQITIYRIAKLIEKEDPAIKPSTRRKYARVINLLYTLGPKGWKSLPADKRAFLEKCVPADTLAEMH